MQEFILIFVLLFLWSMFTHGMAMAGKFLNDKEPKVRLMGGVMCMLAAMFFGVMFLAVALSALAHYFNEINILLNVLPVRKL